MSLVLVRKPLFPAPPRWFAQHQIRSSLFFLGEHVDTPELVDENVAAKLEVAKLLGEAGLDVHVSVDPTQIGYSLDPERARNNAFLIAEAVAQGGTGRPGVHALMFDMEDQSIIDGTIALHSVLFSAKMPVALTLQAYLLRTEFGPPFSNPARHANSPGEGRLCSRTRGGLYAQNRYQSELSASY